MEDNFLTSQIITYIGNKRLLLKNIEDIFSHIHKTENKSSLICLDLFSGSGIVARLMKKHSSLVIANDLELYSEIINNCYLSNPSEFNEGKYNKYRAMIDEALTNPVLNGIISSNYAPKDDENILLGERVFYTTENAIIIDTIRHAIDSIEPDYKKYFLAPLLYAASVNNNTAGVFKGFYKDSKTGIGKYGGNAENALSRIKAKIILPKPVLSSFNTDYKVYRSDANTLVKDLPYIDVVYVDPPYNQHPYGSNYFMLNIIAKNKIEGELSPVSGIPNTWNRSPYNKQKYAKDAFVDLIHTINSRYIIISYSSEGFISYDDMKSILTEYGDLYIKEIKYNTYKASRNLSSRSNYVKEFLFVLKKD